MIKILFFAKYRESIGFSTLDYVSESSQSVSDVIRALLAKYGANAGFLADQNLLIAVNQEMASARTVINDGDELAFFPPVTGG